MYSNNFAAKLKKRLGVLPNVFVLSFIAVLLLTIAFAYYFGLNSALTADSDNKLDDIKKNNIELLSTNLEPTTFDQSLNIFNQRFEEEIQESSDLIILGSQWFYLNKDCTNELSKCKFFKLNSQKEYEMIQNNFGNIIGEDYLYFDEIRFSANQPNYLKLIKFDLYYQGIFQSDFNYTLSGDAFVNSDS